MLPDNFKLKTPMVTLCPVFLLSSKLSYSHFLVTDFEQVQAVKVLSKVLTVLSKKQVKTVTPMKYWLSDYQVRCMMLIVLSVLDYCSLMYFFIAL